MKFLQSFSTVPDTYLCSFHHLSQIYICVLFNICPRYTLMFFSTSVSDLCCFQHVSQIHIYVFSSSTSVSYTYLCCFQHLSQMHICVVFNIWKRQKFRNVQKSWLCQDNKCAHFAVHLTLMTGNIRVKCHLVCFIFKKQWNCKARLMQHPAGWASQMNFFTCAPKQILGWWYFFKNILIFSSSSSENMELQVLCDKVGLFPLSQQMFLHLHQQSNGLGANNIPLYGDDAPNLFLLRSLDLVTIKVCEWVRGCS